MAVKLALALVSASLAPGARIKLHHNSTESQHVTTEDHFRAFDRDGNGLITQQEVEAHRGTPLTPEQKASMLEADVSGDAQVSYEEFAQATQLCQTGCCSQACAACVNEVWSISGSCRWCAETMQCHNRVSPYMQCQVGINSVGQCWSQTCPNQQGMFLPRRIASALAWFTNSLADAAKPLQQLPLYPTGVTGLFDLSTGQALSSAREGGPASSVVISAVSDWASGTCEARVVGLLMALENPKLTFHLGDIYYNGNPYEVDKCVAGIAPNSNQIGVAFPKGSVATFLLNANHEMLSGGTGYFQNGFRYSGQQATYGVWQSDNWRVVVLDTGFTAYNTLSGGARNLASESDAPQPQAIVDWLINVVRLGDPEDTRGIVIFSHHQPYDAWEKTYIGTARQLNGILPAGKQIVWFFGHAHAFAIYNLMQVAKGGFLSDFSFYGRLVGHGGFPSEGSPPERPEAVLAYDSRVYQTITQSPLSPAKIGFHGFFKLVANDTRLGVSYIFAKCKASGCDDGYDEDEGEVLGEETFEVDPATGGLQHELTQISEKLIQPNGASVRTVGLAKKKPSLQKALDPSKASCATPQGFKKKKTCAVNHSTFWTD